MNASSRFFLGLFCFTAGVSAHAHDAKLANTIPHHHLLFSKLYATMEMLDEGKVGDPTNPAVKVVVKWDMKKPDDGTAGNKNVYYAVISFYRPGTMEPMEVSKTYSLLSLGFQAVDWETEIIGVPLKGSAELILESGLTQTPIDLKPPLSAPISIPRTGKQWQSQWDANGGKEVLISNNVCMLRLSGASEFKFTVREVNAPRSGVTRWDNASVSDGHDNQPPKNPPD